MNVNRASSKEDLVTYVREVMGVDPGDRTRMELLDLIEENKSDSAAVVPPMDVVSEAMPSAKRERTKIIIPKVESAMGNADVFVAVNESTYLIRRGEEVEVPNPVVEALRNAVERRARQNDDGTLEHYEIPAYPFQVVG